MELGLQLIHLIPRNLWMQLHVSRMSRIGSSGRLRLLEGFPKRISLGSWKDSSNSGASEDGIGDHHGLAIRLVTR